MKNMKKSKFAASLKKGAAVVAGGYTALMAQAALAVDTAAVQTSIDAAKADGLTVGEMVIGAVAGLVVIGIIIAMIRKL